MNQVYDPLAYADRTGAAVSQIGRNVANTLGNFFQQNAQWKQFKSNQKSDDDAKMNVYDTTLKLLQEKGIDPSQINIPKPTDKRITPEDYTAKLAESIQHVFVGSGNRPTAEDASKIGVANQPGVKESLAQQSFLDKNDTLNQIDLNGTAGTPAPGGIPVSNANEEVNPMLQDILGAKQSAPAPEEDEVGKYYDPLAKSLMDDVRANRLSAQAASTEMRGILENKSKMQYLKAQGDLAEKKAKIKADEDERKKQREDAASGVLSAQLAGYPVTGKDGSEGINALDVQKNPENYTIGNDNPYKRTDWLSGSAGGSGGRKADTIKSIDDRITELTAVTKRMTGRYDKPLPGLEAQYKLNARQIKTAQIAKNFIQSKGGETSLTADEAVQEVSGLIALRESLESYLPIVPVMENAVNRKPEDILQEGAKFFNALPRDVYEKLRLSLEAGESPRSVFEKLKAAGL